MDAANLFDTRATAAHLRAEFGIGLVVTSALAVVHLQEIDWLAFAVLFAYIDVLGYLPGVVFQKRNPGAPVPRVYYVLYNATHSLISAAVVAGIWCLTFGPEWALLALPIHLCGDRALFGNFMKPFAVAFEPRPHPAYQQLRLQLESAAPVGHEPLVDRS